MKCFWFILVIPAVLGQTGFGRSYLRNSRLCHQWSCINTKLGLPDLLPSKDLAEDTLRRVLPQGQWQEVVDNILDGCYGNRTRRYTNTCPGQALMHCVVDQMNEFCPEDSQRKGDACSVVSSLAGLKYMFSQSRYFNLKENLSKERRPEWFLKNYFDQPCCDLPAVFNSTVLQECGFSSVITYYNHEPKYKDDVTETTTTASSNEDVVKFVDLSQMKNTDPDTSTTDPLDCCDMDDFIHPAWRSECGFQLSWQGQDRLVIANNTPVTTEVPTTTTVKADPPKDLMLVPQSCEAETCVFQKLGILDTDKINTLAFMKMLDNYTDAHSVWKKATARVVTKCLNNKVRDYDTWDGCEINKLLACTLDILTENCPYKRKMNDACRHHKQKTGCQISSSKQRPKNRREICLLPQLVSQDVLHECGLDSLYKAEHVVVPDSKPKKIGWAASQYLCEEQKPSTTCLMSKMGVLNKYKFMDYFGMKNKIRTFMDDEAAWAATVDIYTSAFTNVPLYNKHCSSQKKLLNILDAMLMTCPVSKRSDTPQCRKIFRDMTETTPNIDLQVSSPQLDEIMKHYHHIFLPNQPTPSKFDRVIRRHRRPIYKKPLFKYGVLDSKHSPKVKLISIKPAIVHKPVVNNHNLQLATPFYNNGVLRGNPFWLHERIAQAHKSTTASSKPTVYSVPTNVPSTTDMIQPTIPTFTEPDLQMMKPE